MKKTFLTTLLLAVSIFVAYAVTSLPYRLTLKAMPTEAIASDSTSVPDTQPLFPGGLGAVMKFMSENVAFPQELHGTDIKGKVIVKFTVEADGTVTNAKVEKSLNPLIDSEVLKALQKMPRWSPATLKGQPVAADCFLPVKVDNKATDNTVQSNNANSSANRDKWPQFPGGEKKFYEYVINNTKFPAKAIDQGLMGYSTVGFSIADDGSVTDVKVLEVSDPMFKYEAMRVIATMPRWTNMQQSGGRNAHFKVEIGFGAHFVEYYDTLGFNDSNKHIVHSRSLETVNNPFIPGLLKPHLSNGENVFDRTAGMPSFPGGNEKLMEYLNKNIVYPKNAVKQGKQGTVIVSFVVDKDGSITEVEVVRGIDPLLDNEAKRVVAGMPKWNPGKMKGNPVRVKYKIPAKFRLTGSVLENTHPLTEKEQKIYAERLEMLPD